MAAERLLPETSLGRPVRVSRLADVSFLVLAPVVAHMFLSGFGFNPTDDGWVLAGARRILNGDVPHRDLISPNVQGSHYLHVPFVFLAGDYLLWLSRGFVWFQFALIAWIWSLLITESFGVRSIYERFALGLLGMMVTAHVFPVMAWRSIDALLSASLGIWLARRPRVGVKTFGYLLIGVSPIFRQNFALAIPAILMLLGDWRKARYWIAAATPTVLYVVGIATVGGFSDLVLQLTAFGLGELWSRGVQAYLTESVTLGGFVVGIVSANLLRRSSQPDVAAHARWYRMVGTAVCLGMPLVALASMARNGFGYLGSTAFFLLALTAGVVSLPIASDRTLTPPTVLGLLGLLLAWTASISLGYNSPALGIGILVQYVVLVAISAWRSQRGSASVGEPSGPTSWRAGHRGSARLVMAAVLLGSTVLFVQARTSFVYRDAPSSELTHDLGGVLTGGRGIRTNQRTFDFLHDLEVAKRQVRSMGRQYAILPDIPVNWMVDRQENPLSVNWALPSELPIGELIERVVQELETGRGSVVAIVQKYEAQVLAYRLSPLPAGNPIVDYVRSHWRRINETSYFVMYD